MSGHRSLLLLAAALLCVGAAGCTETSTAPVPPPTTTSSGWPWRVASDVGYATVEADYVPAVADVYAPPDATGLPLVVILPEGTDSRRATLYSDIAAALVEGGAVVVVPDWAPVDPTAEPSDGSPFEEIVRHNEHNASEIVCALAFAVDTARQRGADPSRLVLLGFGGGANFGAVAAWLPTTPLDDCSVDPVLPAVTGFVLWDGDWVGGAVSTWLGDRTATFLRTFSPWPRLGEVRTSSRVVLARGANEQTNFIEEHVNAVSTWMSMRDPTGEITAAHERVRAFDDGKITIFEVTDAFSLALTDHGIANEVLVLDDPVTEHLELAPLDFETLVGKVLALASS